MSILAVLIPLSILFLVGAGIALFWAVDRGQFDDMETPRFLPLLDRDEAVEVTSADSTPSAARGGQ